MADLRKCPSVSDDKNKAPDPSQDPYDGFGTTHVSSAARRDPDLAVPTEIMGTNSGTFTKDEYDAWAAEQ